MCSAHRMAVTSEKDTVKEASSGFYEELLRPTKDVKKNQFADTDRITRGAK